MAKKLIGLSWMAWAFLLTSLTYFLGAPAMRAVRMQAGRGNYWLFAALICGLGILAGFQVSYAWALTGMFLSVLLLIGLFCEFEEMGLDLVWSSVGSFVVTGCFLLGGLGIWFSQEGRGLIRKTQEAMSPLLSAQPELGLTFEKIAGQLPSLILILWMLAIYSAVIMEGRIQIQPQTHSRFRSQLFNLKARGWLVWLFIACLYPAFGGAGNRAVELIALNVLNVCVAFFFFQGLGIIHQFLLALRVGLFWQVLLVIFLILQLFIFVSVLGLADYWMDFRTRLLKRKKSQLETFNRREK